MALQIIKQKMNKKNNIEGLEIRNFNASELRVENKESREVVGYGSVFNSELCLITIQIIVWDVVHLELYHYQ